MEISSLLGAPECAEFIECYRGKKVCLRDSADHERFKPLWEEWELDALCRFTPLTNVDRFRLLRDAKRIPPAGFRDRFGMVRADAVRQLFAGGVTVSLANLEFYSDPVLSVSRSLERLLGSPAQFSLYATPKASQALGAHRDEHDVLVLQMRGSKRWRIWHSVEDRAKEADEPQEYTLNRGSWLYVPKNMRHEVKNVGDEPSVHLTIGFHPLTWGTIFQDALTRACMASPALNETMLADPLPTETIESLTERLRSILPFVNLRTQADDYYAHYPGFAEAVPAPIARATVESIAETSRLVWRTEHASLDVREGSLAINADYRRRPLEMRTELEATLQFMAGGAEFRPTDLRPPEPATAVPLCKFLALVGALRLVG